MLFRRTAESSARLCPKTAALACLLALPACRLGFDLAVESRQETTLLAVDAADAGPADAALPECSVGTFLDDTQAAVSCVPCAVGGYCAGASAGVEPCAAGSWDHDADAATRCVAHSTCAAGEFEVEAGGPASDRVCGPCGPETFSQQAGASECVAWSVCESGRFVEAAGSRVKDVTCAGCPPGTFSSEPNQSECAAWRDCLPGEFVLAEGDAASDRSCSACPESSFSEKPNAPACTDVGECEPGTVQTAPATQSRPAQCADCAPGEFCPGADDPADACADGSWDHDADPSTACAPHTECQPGASVQDPGSSTTDRICAPCTNGFSTVVNAPACNAWTDCPAPSQYMVSAPTATSDRECGDCVLPLVTLLKNEWLCRLLDF